MKLINRILRNRREFIKECLEGKLTTKEICNMLGLCLAFFGLYGVVIGLNFSALQALSSAVKLPLLFFGTGLICFPSLYFFQSILGIKWTFKELISFLVACLSIMSLCLMALLPISIFFLIISDGYHFYKFINVVITGVSGGIGVYSFYTNFKEKAKALEEGNDRRNVFLFLRFWVILFMLIGTQLSYTLSPFFGEFGKDFMLFTDQHRNFFVDVMDTIMKMF